LSALASDPKEGVVRRMHDDLGADIGPAIGRFSITNGWPSRSENHFPMRRAVVSASPPEGAPTMTRAGRDGEVWAHAKRDKSGKASANVSFWPAAELRRAGPNVRSQSKSGNHLLPQSFTAHDPGRAKTFFLSQETARNGLRSMWTRTVLSMFLLLGAWGQSSRNLGPCRATGTATRRAQ
jgi:hypothetical protein